MELEALCIPRRMKGKRSGAENAEEEETIRGRCLPISLSDCLTVFPSLCALCVSAPLRFKKSARQVFVTAPKICRAKVILA